MDIIKCKRTSDFNGAIRNYYDVHDLRLLDVSCYKKEEQFHKHTKVTEVLFVVEGAIKAITKTEAHEIYQHQVIVFHPDEFHKIEPISLAARIIAIKYIQGDKNLIELFTGDWMGE